MVHTNTNYNMVYVHTNTICAYDCMADQTQVQQYCMVDTNTNPGTQHDLYVRQCIGLYLDKCEILGNVY